MAAQGCALGCAPGKPRRGSGAINHFSNAVSCRKGKGEQGDPNVPADGITPMMSSANHTKPSRKSTARDHLRRPHWARNQNHRGAWSYLHLGRGLGPAGLTIGNTNGGLWHFPRDFPGEEVSSMAGNAGPPGSKSWLEGRDGNAHFGGPLGEADGMTPEFLLADRHGPSRRLRIWIPLHRRPQTNRKRKGSASPSQMARRLTIRAANWRLHRPWVQNGAYPGNTRHALEQGPALPPFSSSWLDKGRWVHPHSTAWTCVGLLFRPPVSVARRRAIITGWLGFPRPAGRPLPKPSAGSAASILAPRVRRSPAMRVVSRGTATRLPPLSPWPRRFSIVLLLRRGGSAQEGHADAAPEPFSASLAVGAPPSGGRIGRAANLPDVPQPNAPPPRADVARPRWSGPV